MFEGNIIDFNSAAPLWNGHWEDVKKGDNVLLNTIRKIGQ